MILFGDDCAGFTAEMVEEIINAKFAPIVNKADQYDELCKIGGTLLPLRIKVEEYDNVVKERDDLKKALGDLVESYEACKQIKFMDARAPVAKDRFNNALAAVKKLLEEHEQG